MENQDELEKEIEAITSLMTVEELVQALQENNVPAGRVADSKDLFNDPQLKSRGLYRKIYHPLLGNYWVMQSPAIYSRTPQMNRMHAPYLGQDNESVCREILKMTPEEIRTLISRGAISSSAYSGRESSLSIDKGEKG